MILDSSVVIAFAERRDPAAIDAILGLGDPGARSMFVLGEIQRGVDAPGDPAKRLQRLRTKLAYLELTRWPDSSTYSLTRVAESYAMASTIATERGIRVGQNDRWIVAEAVAASTQVLTYDHAMHQLGSLLSAGEPVTVLVD